MEENAMNSRKTRKKKAVSKRKTDPYLDRRSGEDRRRVYSLDYFFKGNLDRRNSPERRTNSERRVDCIRINEWSSICPDNDEIKSGSPYIIDLR